MSAFLWCAAGLLGGVAVGYMAGYTSGAQGLGDALSPLSDEEREELLRRIGKGRPAPVVKLVPPLEEPAPAPEPDPTPDPTPEPVPPVVEAPAT